MTKQEIINAINTKIAGQGNMLDISGDLPSILLGIVGLTDDINDEVESINDELESISTLVESKASKEEIDDFEDFDATTEYSTNDIVRYEDKLYKFTSDHSGDWSGEDVQQTNVTSILS